MLSVRKPLIPAPIALTPLALAPLALALMTPAAVAATASTTSETVLTASDGAASDYFGHAVGISGGAAIVGAYAKDDAGTNSGAAYLFDVATGAEIAKLAAPTASAHDGFGISVGISGGAAIVGAHFGDQTVSNAGAAYLFDATTGAAAATLAASDAALGDRFGFSVGIDGAAAIVGAYGDDDAGSGSGSAYLFDVATGDELAKLTASDAAAGDAFGYSVGLSGDTAIVGAGFKSDAGANSGAAYLFDVATGAELAKLVAPDAAAGDYFGRSVAISGDIAIVGAVGDADAGSYSGAAYLFDATTGAEIAKLTAPDAAASKLFGGSVAIFGDIALVGAWGDGEASPDAGAAYLFDAATGDFITKIVASSAALSERFGRSVAITGDALIVGADRSHVAGSDKGAAYVYGVAAVVPLPASAWLMISGLGLLALARRRAAGAI